MKAVRPVFPESPELPSRMIAKNQDEFQGLPVADLDANQCIARFELDDQEKQFVAENGYIYISMLHFGRPLMPFLPLAEHPKF